MFSESLVSVGPGKNIVALVVTKIKVITERNLMLFGTYETFQ